MRKGNDYLACDVGQGICGFFVVFYFTIALMMVLSM